MTQEQTLTWAREAGLIQYVQVEKTCVSNALERFAALVAAHERNRHAWTQEHWTEYEHAIAAAARERIAASIDVEEYHRGSWFAREIRSMK